jgi:hypothetical protein
VPKKKEQEILYNPVYLGIKLCPAKIALPRFTLFQETGLLTVIVKTLDVDV